MSTEESIWSACILSYLMASLVITFHKKFHIELKEDTKPTWRKLFQTPYWYKKIFVEEVDKIIAAENILKRKHRWSKWMSPTFCTAKKYGHVKVVTNLFVNWKKHLVCCPCALLRIQDITHKWANYKYFTKIDLSMCFCCFKLDKPSKNITTTTIHSGVKLL